MPRIALATPEPTALGVPSTEGINPDIDVAQRALYRSVRGLRRVDPEVSELVRLRNAAAQGCQLCLGLRNRQAIESGLTEEDVAAATSGDPTTLGESAQSAIALADSFLGYPGDVPEVVLQTISAALPLIEMMELLFELVVWTNNKVSLALGCDLPGVTYQVYDA